MNDEIILHDREANKLPLIHFDSLFDFFFTIAGCNFWQIFPLSFTFHLCSGVTRL